MAKEKNSYAAAVRRLEEGRNVNIQSEQNHFMVIKCS